MNTADHATRPHRTMSSRAAAGLLLLSVCAALGCASPTPRAPGAEEPLPIAIRLHRAGAADMLLLGEQHDAPQHQQIHLEVVNSLLEAHELSAVVLEMADSGQDTRLLNTQATPEQVRQALAWRESAWPWGLYGPAIMAAVGHNIPVLGGNLPRQRNAQVMREPEWDSLVPAGILRAHQQAVRDGHCNLLPSGQIAPMTRIQLARDRQLAHTLLAAAVPGKTVLLLTGSQHAHKTLGVPLHLPPHLRVKSIRLAANGPHPDDATAFDAVWPTLPAPERDHCAEIKGQTQGASGARSGL